MTTWKASLWFMRIACPLAMVAALVVAAFAWSRGLYFTFGIDLFLAGINLVLTWVQWRVLPTNLPRR